MRYLIPFFGLLLVGCDHGIYTRDGVTDGDSFYLAPSAYANDDPAFQSWVTYSLIKSTCQLKLGGENPARANSFDCEYRSRQQLLNSWEEKSLDNPEITDPYLDALSDVRAAGFLAEYTVYFFGDNKWQTPAGLREAEFRDWRRQNLRRHRARTRITGSWNFRNVVTRPAG